MKILLLGEFSNVHNNLAEGLRTLGHDVTTANGGHGWSNYHRDIDLGRSFGLWGGISFMFRLLKAMCATSTRHNNQSSRCSPLRG